jgi:hypothetical protein
MIPAPRDLPVIDAIGPRADGSYVVKLPGHIYRVAASPAAASRLVRREAPGSAVRFLPVPATPVSRSAADPDLGGLGRRQSEAPTAQAGASLHSSVPVVTADLPPAVARSSQHRRPRDTSAPRAGAAVGGDR